MGNVLNFRKFPSNPKSYLKYKFYPFFCPFKGRKMEMSKFRPRNHFSQLKQHIIANFPSISKKNRSHRNVDYEPPVALNKIEEKRS